MPLRPHRHVDWVARDAAVVWHGFTQMSCYADNQPIIVECGEGRELIDVHGVRYLDAISSLWVTTLGHAVPELDAAIRDQLDRVAHSTMLGKRQSHRHRAGRGACPGRARQRGLMCGVELLPPIEGLLWGRRVCAAAVRRGVLLRPLGDVVVVMPPLTITTDEIERIVEVLCEAITEVCE